LNSAKTFSGKEASRRAKFSKVTFFERVIHPKANC
jgi:hypothetical protein